MTGAAKWLRRFEIALAVVGISILGGVLAATVLRWNFQARQERAFVQREEALAQQEQALAQQEQAVAPQELAVAPQEQAVAQQEQALVATDPIAVPSVIDQPPADPFEFARIEIPRVGVNAIVREGVDDATLALAVGHIGWTALPGEIGNIALAGHRDTFFRGLRDIRLDDRIRLYVPPHSYEYRVVSLEVVTPKETRVLDPTGGQELTLVTCHPFAFVGQ